LISFNLEKVLSLHTDVAGMVYKNVYAMYILGNEDIKLNVFNNFNTLKTVILVLGSSLLSPSESALVLPSDSLIIYSCNFSIPVLDLNLRKL